MHLSHLDTSLRSCINAVRAFATIHKKPLYTLTLVRFVPCLAQYSRRDFFGIRVGLIEPDNFFCLLHLNVYFIPLSVYIVQLTD